MMHFKSVLGTLTLALGVFGCSSAGSSGGSAATTAASGEDVSQTESDTEALASLHVGAASGGLTPAYATRDGQPGPVPATGLAPMTGALAGELLPAGCLTTTTDAAGHRNTYTYADCSGPYGLVHLTGTIDVSYASTGPDNLTLDFSASGFQINKATLSSWSATAVITASGGTDQMVWSATLAGTTGSGRAFTRTDAETITWDPGGTPACIAVSGSAEGTVAGARLKTTIAGYQRCADACPKAGSSIDILNEDDGTQIDITYDGGPAATVTETVGAKTEGVTIPLACGLI